MSSRTNSAPKKMPNIMRAHDDIVARSQAIDAEAGAALGGATNALIEHLRASGAVVQALTVDEPVPDFALPNAAGRRVALQDVLRRGPAIIAFCLGDWSPVCRLYVRTLGEIAAGAMSEGATILVISPQKKSAPAPHPSAAERIETLFDADNRIARLFGLSWRVPAEIAENFVASGIDIAALNGTDIWELPLPATYVVGPDWLVRYAFVDADIRRRPEPAELLAILTRLVRESRDAI